MIESDHPIKLAAAEADNMIRALASGQPPVGPAPEPEPEPEDQGQVEPDTAPDIAHDAPSENADAAGTEQDRPSDVDDIRAEVARWKDAYGLEHQRYKSLQGMITQRDAQIAQLHELLANLQSAPAPRPAPEITSEDETAFGADLVDMARRAARAENKVLLDEIERIKSQVGGVQQASARSAFQEYCARVADAVDQSTGGRFTEINESPEFEAWIDESPAISATFNEARGRLDVAGALTVYRMYDTTALTSKPKTAPPAVDPRLARQVAPGKSRSTPTPASQPEGAKRQWTRTGITEFYESKASLPHETAVALEKDLFAAQREGRVDLSR